MVKGSCLRIGVCKNGHMRSLVLLPLLLLLASCGGGADRPNVVLLIMDTARGDRCSVNGYERPTTPQLEKIAAEGLNFRNAWSPGGWTGPSHASMFTGLLPARHGFFHGNRDYLEDAAVTLAERLGRAGYATACFSNNANVSREFGLTQGFQTDERLFLKRVHAGPPSIRTHELAIEWVRKMRKADRPFFLFINDIEPHLPYTPTREFEKRFVPGDIDPATVHAARGLVARQWWYHNLKLRLVPPEQVRALSSLYDAEIALLDEQVGRFVDALRNDGVLEDTLLIITSDHGEYLGEHDLLSHEFGMNRCVRYVPLVLRLPGAARAGEVHDEVVRLEDIYPTVEEACGLDPLRDLDGKSLLGDLADRRAIGFRGALVRKLDEIGQEQSLPVDFGRYAISIRDEFDGRYHRLEYSDGRTELFDILEDPAETKPLKR